MENITEYAYHYRALLMCNEEKELEAVGASIKKTVPASHKELKPLQEAYRVRRNEIRQKAAEEAAKKAKEEAEKANAEIARFVGGGASAGSGK